MRIPALGLRGAAIALVAGDLFTAVFVVRESLRLLDEHLGVFARSLLDVSLLSKLWTRRERVAGEK